MKKTIYNITLVLNKKDYISFIDESGIDCPFEKTFIGNREYVIMQYAWTISKKMKNQFLAFRNGIFKVKKHKIDEDLLHDFRNSYGDTELDYHALRFYRGGVEIERNLIMTKAEYDAVIEWKDSKLFDITYDCTESEWRCLKDDYKTVLDETLYTYFHDLRMEDDVIGEYAEYNAGFGIGPYGSPIEDTINSIDEIALFVHMFRKVLL